MDVISEACVSRPAFHFEATQTYIAMHDILERVVVFFQEDNVLRLKELLLSCRIAPRLTVPQFNKMMRLLVKELTDDDLTEFHRAVVTKGQRRNEWSVDEFATQFAQGSLLLHQKPFPDETEDGFVDFAIVQQVWDAMQSDLGDMFDFFDGRATLEPDNLTLRMYLDDAIRLHSNLLHSLDSRNGALAMKQLYQFVFALDILFSASVASKQTMGTLMSMECAIREDWLENVI
jgi:hypothetical protein